MAAGIPVMIVGATGTGKSTSMRNLPRKMTAYLNAERKPLPFRDRKFAKLGEITSTTQLVNAMKAIEKDDTIKIVVFDSISMYAGGPVFKELVEGVDGFEGWNNYKKHILAVIDMMKSSKKNYIVTALEEQVSDSNKVMTYVAGVQGSLKGALESHFSIVLRAMTVDDIDSPTGVSYKLATNRIPGERISAKSPMEMFSDLYIDNDLVEVFKTINSYYK